MIKFVGEEYVMYVYDRSMLKYGFGDGKFDD
jgi:hypothetical protein